MKPTRNQRISTLLLTEYVERVLLLMLSSGSFYGTHKIGGTGSCSWSYSTFVNKAAIVWVGCQFVNQVFVQHCMVISCYLFNKL